jgi:hypothetical protein
VATGLVREQFTGGLVVANQAGSLGSHTLVVFPPFEDGDEIVPDLSGPEQIAYLPAVNDENPYQPTQLLFTEAFGATGGGLLRSLVLDAGDLVDFTWYEFTNGEEPRGVWPLLTPGLWLVAGTNGLGVQVVNPGFVAEGATPVGDFSEVDAQYISRVCLGFDPRGQ